MSLFFSSLRDRDCDDIQIHSDKEYEELKRKYNVEKMRNDILEIKIENLKSLLEKKRGIE